MKPKYIIAFLILPFGYLCGSFVFWDWVWVPSTDPPTRMFVLFLTLFAAGMVSTYPDHYP